MPPYSVSRDDKLPILYITYTTEYDIAQHVETQIEEIVAHLDRATGPLFLVVDTADMNVDMHGITLAANLTARQSNAMLDHPNLQATCLITQNRVIDMAAKGLRSPVFGNRDVHVVTTYAEAFAFVTERM